MEPVRIAVVPYLNTLPLIEGLDKARGAEVIPAPPSTIAGTLHSETLGESRNDIGLCSVIDIARSEGALSLLPVGMIGCDGPTLTVRIFSRVPLDQITELHTDTDSHTSVVLAKVILSRVYGVAPKIVPFDAREGRPPQDESFWPESVLLIGDKVVTSSPEAVRAPHQLDLGEAWKEHTALPFVYAVWACRTEDAESDRVRTAAVLLDRTRRRNARRMDAIISQRAADKRWPDDLARRYLGELLRFDVGPREREAVEKFFELAHEVGEGDGAAPRWVELQPAAAPGR